MQWTNQLQKEGKLERAEVYGPLSGTQQLFSGVTVVEGNEVLR